MGTTTGLADQQRRTLGRLRAVRELDRYYLAGGTAIGFHLSHRLSLDLDLFSEQRGVELEQLRAAVLAAIPEARVIAVSEVTLRLRVGDSPLDIVNYQYPPLEPLTVGPEGFRVAGLLDLATMKLAAISRRGLRRDFWDLFAILQSGHSLVDAAEAYVRRFGAAEADLYHVMRSLTYFADAEREAVYPRGLTPDAWESIKSYFLRSAPELLRP